MSVDVLLLALFLGLGAAAATHDLLAHAVPNALCAAIAATGLAVALVDGHAGSALGGMAVGLALLSPLFAARWLGGGDVKLAAAIGTWLGAATTLWMILGGLALGGIWAAAIALRSGRGREVVRRLRAAAATGTAPIASPLTVPLAVPLVAMAAALRLGAL